MSLYECGILRWYLMGYCDISWYIMIYIYHDVSQQYHTIFHQTWYMHTTQLALFWLIRRWVICTRSKFLVQKQMQISLTKLRSQQSTDVLLDVRIQLLDSSCCTHQVPVTLVFWSVKRCWAFLAFLGVHIGGVSLWGYRRFTAFAADRRSDCNEEAAVSRECEKPADHSDRRWPVGLFKCRRGQVRSCFEAVLMVWFLSILRSHWIFFGSDPWVPNPSQ